MIQDTLRSVIEQNARISNSLYLRTLLKEAVQDLMLRFVYNDPEYKKLIFTGGTCLRKLYGLPRLSEDLDFDSILPFDLESFSADVKKYFAEKLQYPSVETKISNQQKTAFFKFPVLTEIGFAASRSDSSILMIRCDISPAPVGHISFGINSLSTSDAVFFVRAYTLEMLFANKLLAFLGRDFFKGKEQTVSFKGRDVFDLVWFLARSAKTGYEFQPDWERMFAELQVSTKKEVCDLLIEKVKMVDPKGVRDDLLPFVESSQSAQDVADHFREDCIEKLKKFV